ncbi:FAD-binding oxidoreductase [Actinomycetospora sp. OC33-EN08]|uniref:FAD-binding oxidoreductase n=1 Tax=Actinomycetospora aurantiaca TaxID=3129233 RepID=A0ABU8MUC1_9PSEU
MTTVESIARGQGLEPSRVVTEVDEATLPMWNAATPAGANVVVRCRDTADVQAAIRTARAAGLGLSVFSGGNDWAGRSVLDGGLVADISALDHIEVDVESRTARVGGGARSDLVSRETEEAGLTPVTGTVGLVHMLGLTLGGGYGPLNGRFGLACDNLVSAELVTADATVVRVDEQNDPDLLWALRGGGGNFGVVTSAVVRLHEVGPVYTGMIIFPWSQATSVLTGLNPLLSSCPDELSLQTVISSGPDGDPFVAVMPTWSGSLAEGPAAVAPVEALGDPIAVDMGTSAWHAAMTGVSASFPPGRHVRIRTRNVPDFSPRVVERLVTAGSSRNSPYSALSIHPFHGAATRIPLESAAFGERRRHQMVEIVGMWLSGDESGARDGEWADEVHRSLADDAMPGGYVNLLAADDRNQVRSAYGPNTDCLLAVKDRVDPTGVFTATPLPSDDRRAAHPSAPADTVRAR